MLAILSQYLQTILDPIQQLFVNLLLPRIHSMHQYEPFLSDIEPLHFLFQKNNYYLIILKKNVLFKIRIIIISFFKGRNKNSFLTWITF